MPVVPMLSWPQVDPAPLPTVRVSPDAPAAAFGVPGEGPDLSGVARQVGQLYDQARQKADLTSILDADNQLSTVRQAEQQRVLSAQGKNAMDAASTVPDTWGKAVDGIEGTLANDTQRLAFRRRAAAQWDELNSTVESHVAQQSRIYQDQTTQGAIAGRYTDAMQAAAGGDFRTVQQKLAETRAIIADHGWQLGLPAEAVQASQQQAASNIHMGVLAQFANARQDTAAQQYLAAHRDELTGDDLIRAEGLTARVSVLGEAQRQADDILGSATSLDAGMKAAATIGDPNVRQEAERRIREHFDDVATTERQQREDAFVRVQSTLRQNGGNLDGVSVTDLNRLTPGEMDSALAFADRIRHPKRYTDPDAYHTLMNLAGTDPQAFARLDLSDPQYRSALDDGDWRRMNDLQRQINAQALTQAQRQRAKDQATQRAMDFLRSQGLNVGPGPAATPPRVPGAPLPSPGSPAPAPSVAPTPGPRSSGGPAGLNLKPVSDASGVLNQVRPLRAPTDYVLYGLERDPDYLLYLDHMGALG